MLNPEHFYGLGRIFGDLYLLLSYCGHFPLVYTLIASHLRYGTINLHKFIRVEKRMVDSQNESELLPFVDKLNAFGLPGFDLAVH